ncbi:MAG: hypothetical protein KAS72_00585 [Phycisphaerales bacterium]|nr:hypothetical protein [Phycisphaerales bacterium]
MSSSFIVLRTLAAHAAVCLLALAAVSAQPLSPEDLRIASSGTADELAQLDLDDNLDPRTAELAVMHGITRTRRENAAILYLEAMLVFPTQDALLASVNGTPDRFDLLEDPDFDTVLRSRDFDTLLRIALQCRTCDFQVDKTAGATTPLPHLREAPRLAEYAAIRADYDLVRGRPWAALRTYIDLRELARDIADGAGIVSLLSGIKLEQMQQHRLMDALPRLIQAGIPAASIERLYASQVRPAPTVHSAFSADTLFQDSLKHAIAALDAGDCDLFWSRLGALHRLRSRTDLKSLVVARKALTEEDLANPQALAAFARNELLLYNEHVDRIITIAGLPAEERVRALRALHEQLVADLRVGILVRNFAPVLPEFADEIFRHNRNIRAMNLLLAAASHRQQSGTWPESLDALRLLRPELVVEDPFQGGSLHYSLENDTVTISWQSGRPGDDAFPTFTWPQTP